MRREVVSRKPAPRMSKALVFPCPFPECASVINGQSIAKHIRGKHEEWLGSASLESDGSLEVISTCGETLKICLKCITCVKTRYSDHAGHADANREIVREAGMKKLSPEAPARIDPYFEEVGEVNIPARGQFGAIMFPSLPHPAAASSALTAPVSGASLQFSRPPASIGGPLRVVQNQRVLNEELVSRVMFLSDAWHQLSGRVDVLEGGNRTSPKPPPAAVLGVPGTNSALDVGDAEGHAPTQLDMPTDAGSDGDAAEPAAKRSRTS